MGRLLTRLGLALSPTLVEDAWFLSILASKIFMTVLWGVVRKYVFTKSLAWFRSSCNLERDAKLLSNKDRFFLRDLRFTTTILVSVLVSLSHSHHSHSSTKTCMFIQKLLASDLTAKGHNFHASKKTKPQSSRASASVRAPLQLERSTMGRFCGLCWPPGSIDRVALLITWTYQASEVCWLRGGEFSSASDSDLQNSALSCRSSFVSDLSKIPCSAFPHPDMSNTRRLGTWKRSLGPLKLRHLNALLLSVAMQHLTAN